MQRLGPAAAAAVLQPLTSPEAVWQPAGRRAGSRLVITSCLPRAELAIVIVRSLPSIQPQPLTSALRASTYTWLSSTHPICSQWHAPHAAPSVAHITQDQYDPEFAPMQELATPATPLTRRPLA
jgi:hypothetical protein